MDIYYISIYVDIYAIASTNINTECASPTTGLTTSMARCRVLDGTSPVYYDGSDPSLHAVFIDGGAGIS
jgi:precorrin-6B methylase 2